MKILQMCCWANVQNFGIKGETNSDVHLQVCEKRGVVLQIQEMGKKGNVPIFKRKYHIVLCSNFLCFQN